MDNRIETDETEIDLLELAHVLLRNSPAIILTTLVTACIGLLYTLFFVTPQYEANALLIVNTRQDVSSNVTSDQINSATKLVNTYSIIIKSDTVLQPTIDNLGLNLDYRGLYNKVDVNAVDSTQVMRVTVTDPNPESARLICEEITRLAPAVIVDAVEAGSAKVISKASTTGVPVSPSKTKNTALAAALGFILSAGLIVVRELLDNKIKSEADVEKYLGLPVVGVIPVYNTNSKGYGYGMPTQKGKGGK